MQAIRISRPSPCALPGSKALRRVAQQALCAHAIIAVMGCSTEPEFSPPELNRTAGAGGGASAEPSRPEAQPPVVGLSGSGETTPDVAGLAGGKESGSADGGSADGGRAVPSLDGACTASAANASGYCWRSVAIGGGGFVSAVVASSTEQDLVYARTDVGGAYRWDEASQGWMPLNDWVSENETGLLGIESLALDPNDARRVYLLAGISYFNNGKTAIVSSEDYGQTFVVHDVTNLFRAHGNGAGRQNGERLAVDPSDGAILLVGTRRDGLFRSADHGVTWSRLAALDVTTTPNDNGISFVVFDAAGGTIEGATRHIFVGVSRLEAPNLFESRDAGATFAPVAGQPTGFMPQRAVLGPDNALLLTYANGAGPNGSPSEPMDRGAIWKLELDLGVWTEITPLRGNQNRAFGGLSVDRSDPRRILATTINTYQQNPWGYGDRIFLTTDAGVSWVDLFGEGRLSMDTNGIPWIEDHSIHWVGSVQIDPYHPERAWLTSGNGVFMTNDLGAERSTLSFAARGLEEVVPLDVVSVRGAPLISAIGDYDGFIHDDPIVYPARGRFEPSMGTTGDLSVASLAPSHMARIGNSIYVSTDGAATWREATLPSSSAGGHVTYSADGGTLIWSGAAEAYRSGDDGQSWTAVTGLGADTVEADAVASEKFYAYAPATGSVFVSVDGGATFGQRASLARGGSRRIRSAPGLDGDLWVALYGAGLERSVDSAASFASIAPVDYCAAVGFGAPRSAEGYPAVYIWGSIGGGPRGVYRSDDAGATFQRINDDRHQYGGPGNGQFVVGDANVYGRVYLSTAGRGLALGELAPPGAAQ